MLGQLDIQLKGKSSTKYNAKEDLIPPKEATGQRVRHCEWFEGFATPACRDWKQSETSISVQYLLDGESPLTPIMLEQPVY